jgi:hypothetical protein
LVVGGKAAGGVLIGRPVGGGLLQALASGVGTELSVVVKDSVQASTIDKSLAQLIATSVADSSKPIMGGKLTKPLERRLILPLFVNPDGEGIAFASLAVPVPGPVDAKFVISVPAAESLRTLADHQQDVLGVLAVALLLALFLGYQMQRIYVRPVGIIVDHLSEFNIGKGPRELPERRVTGPARRLVKLVNMTVQKIPATSARDVSRVAPQENLGLPSLPPPPATDAVAVVSPQIGSLLDIPPSVPSAANAAGIAPIPTGASPSLGSAASNPPLVPSASAWVTRSSGTAGDAYPGSTITPVGADDDTGKESPELPPGADEGFGDLNDELNKALGAAAASLGIPESEIMAPPPRDASEIRGAPAGHLAGSTSAPPVAADLAPPPAAPVVEDTPISSTEQADLLSYLNELKAGGGAADAGGNSTPQAVEAKAPSAPPFEPPPPEPEKLAEDDPAYLQVGGSAAADGLGMAGLGLAEDEDDGGFRGEQTVVAAPDDELLAQSATGGLTAAYNLGQIESGAAAPDRTVVAEVPSEALEDDDGFDEDTGVSQDPAEIAENEHFKETYERFIDMRKACGEPTADLSFFRFLEKLKKNRDALVSKYNCRTVRFQVYRKEGKAALKATPIKS